jgi:hypothetical protein
VKLSNDTETVSINKHGHDVEKIVLNAFLRCRKRLSDIRTEDFANYRDELLLVVKLTTLKHQLSPLHNLFEVARSEWNLPIKENPLSKLQLSGPSERRERRLRKGELEVTAPIPCTTTFT